MKLTPYLFFDGNCREAFEFYADLLGGEMQVMMTFGESPARDHVSEDSHDRIIHACLAADGQTLMASDVPAGEEHKPRGLKVSLHLDDVTQAERVFNALAEGGEVQMPFGETFWAKGFGMATDRFGTPWMVNCSAEEE